MTTIFSDGFDDGTFNAWTGSAGTGITTVTDTLSHHGTYCEKVDLDNGEWAYRYKDFVGGKEIYSRCYLRFDAVPNANAEYIPLGIRNRISGNDFAQPMLWHDGSNLFWGVELREGTVYDRSNLESPASNPSVDTWYCVELYLKAETTPTSTDGIMRLWINGVLKVEKLNCNITDADINRIDCGTNINNTGAHINVYIDCVVVADAYIGVEAEIVYKDVAGLISGLGSVGLAYPVRKLAVLGSVEGLGSVLRGKSFIVLGDADGQGYVITDKGEVYVLGKAKVEDIFR